MFPAIIVLRNEVPMTEILTKRVLIMAGGTGGHIFPGLAVAKYLKTLGASVHWLGSKTGFEVDFLKGKDNIASH